MHWYLGSNKTGCNLWYFYAWNIFYHRIRLMIFQYGSKPVLIQGKLDGKMCLTKFFQLYSPIIQLLWKNHQIPNLLIINNSYFLASYNRQLSADIKIKNSKINLRLIGNNLMIFTLIFIENCLLYDAIQDYLVCCRTGSWWIYLALSLMSLVIFICRMFY